MRCTSYMRCMLHTGRNATVTPPRPQVAELYKVARAGQPALLNFFELTFRPLADFGDEVMFGDALFGGPSSDSAR